MRVCSTLCKEPPGASTVAVSSNYDGRRRMKLHGWYFEEQVLFWAGKTLREVDESGGFGA
jgi:hypothetical protein